MIVYPNQDVVVIYKQPCDTENIYMKTNINALRKAAKELDAGEFKLFCYLSKNQDGYQMALSSKDIKQN